MGIKYKNSCWVLKQIRIRILNNEKTLKIHRHCAKCFMMLTHLVLKATLGTTYASCSLQRFIICPKWQWKDVTEIRVCPSNPYS